MTELTPVDLLEQALEEVDHPQTRFYIRQALQHQYVAAE